MTAAFNPAEWLVAFTSVGGHYIVTQDERITVGQSLETTTIAEQMEATRLLREVKADSEKAALLKAHLLARQRIPA